VKVVCLGWCWIVVIVVITEVVDIVMNAPNGSAVGLWNTKSGRGVRVRSRGGEVVAFLLVFVARGGTTGGMKKEGP
jgi:hypothetical protein